MSRSIGVGMPDVSRRVMTLLLGLLVLTGCGEQAGKSATARPGEASQQYARATTLQGAVSDNAGPIKAGVVKAVTESGLLIAETALVNTHRYSLTIPAETHLPLLLTFEADNGGEKMLSVVVHPGISKYDINPSSTEIAKQAKALGGYTHANLVRAAESRIAVPEANKTTSGFRGDPTTQYGGWH